MAVKQRLDYDKLAILRDMELETNATQDAFVGSDKRFKMIRGARRIGKSFMAAKDIFPDVLKPNTRGWIVGPSYDLAEKEFRYVLDFLNKAHKKLGLPKPIKVRENSKGGELYIKTAWGSEVFGKSADRPQISLVGEENDWVIMSEAAMHNADTWFRYLRPTLSSRKGRAIFPYTPDDAGMWMYDLELSVMDNPEWGVWTQPAWECPHYDPAEIESARGELPHDAFLEQYGGEFRFYAGRVYSIFQKEIHLIPSFKIPRTWPIRSGIDFGLRDPTASIWLAQSPEGDLYVVDEYYKDNTSTPDHAINIKDIEKGMPRIVCRVADYHALGAQLILDYARLGIPSVRCINNIKARRDRTIAYMTPQEGMLPYHVREFGNNKVGKYPKLFIFKDKCPNLIKEMMFLIWRTGTRKEGTINDTKGENHAIDALEYVTEYSTRGSFRDRQGRKNRYEYKPSNKITGY